MTKTVLHFPRVTFHNDLVTAFPDVSQVTLGSDAEFLVLASDGLWDYISRSICTAILTEFSVSIT